MAYTNQVTILEGYIRSCHLRYLSIVQVLGYKGVPILAIHPPFNVVNGVVTDYLYCVLLGVTKSLIESWFGKSNHGKDFYIGKMVLCVAVLVYSTHKFFSLSVFTLKFVLRFAAGSV